MSKNSIPWWDIIANIVVPIVSLVGGYIIALKVNDKQAERQDKKDLIERKENEEIRVKLAIEELERTIKGRYADYLNKGRAYNELKAQASAITPSDRKTIIDFVNLREKFKNPLFLEIDNELKGKYNYIRNFYFETVKKQPNGCDYVWIDEYFGFIKHLEIDKKIENEISKL